MASQPTIPPPKGVDAGSRDKVPEFLQTPVFHSYRPGKSLLPRFALVSSTISIVVVNLVMIIPNVVSSSLYLLVLSTLLSLGRCGCGC